MARSPYSTAEVEAVLRLMVQSHTLADAARQVFKEDKPRKASSIWLAFRRRLDQVDDTAALKAQLDSLGYTLSEVEINQLRALKNLSNKQKYLPSNLQRRSVSALNSANRPMNPPHSLEFSHEWLLRPGIPYAKTDDNDCSQPVGTVEGNVCGERIETARRLKGKTTCGRCAEAVRAPSQSVSGQATSYTYTR